MTARREFPQPPHDQAAHPDEYDLEKAFRTLRKRMILVALITCLGTALATFVALYVLPSYTATALLIVPPAPNEDPSQMLDTSIDTQITAITSESVLNHALLVLWRKPAVKSAVPRLRDFQRNLKVMQQLRSRLISVSFTAKQPAVAAVVANGLADDYLDELRGQSSQYFKEQFARLAETRAELEKELAQAERGGGPTGPARAVQPSRPTSDQRIADLQRQLVAARSNEILLEAQQAQRDIASPPVRMFSPARTPDLPSSSRPILIVAPGLIASLICGLGLALVLERMKKRFTDTEDAELALGIPCLGGIPRTRKIRSSGPFDFIKMAPRSPYSEAIRSVAVATLLTGPSRPHIILIASSLSGEGKTTFASSYAAYASEIRGSVILVDLDFTRRTGVYGAQDQAPGILDVLTDKCELHQAIQSVSRFRLAHLPLGYGPSDPLPVLMGPRTSFLLRQLGEQYDCVVINGSPVLDIAEARVIAKMADQILFVLKRGGTTRRQASEALEILTSFEPSLQLRAPAVIGSILTFAVEKGRRRRNALVSRLGETSASRTSKRGSPTIQSKTPQKVVGTELASK